jgi:hypothetical protein
MGRANETPPREAEDDPLPARRQRAERKRPVQPSVPEIGGPKGPEPTRFGDWEKGGRCIDF